MHNTKHCQDSSTYLVAHQRAYAWAEKALRFRSIGKFAQAKRAVEQVNFWLQHLATLAPQSPALHRPVDADKRMK
jgi:hypothetical protein